MEKKIVDYMVVSSYPGTTIPEVVNKEIKNGWQLFGGVTSFVITQPDLRHGGTITEIHYSQAMVKYEQ